MLKNQWLKSRWIVFITRLITPFQRLIQRSIKLCTVGLLLCLMALLRADDQTWISKEIIDQAQRDFGDAAKQRLLDWQTLYQDLRNSDEAEQLRSVNQFFNQHVNFVSDDKHWGQKDYWATPYESLTTHGADCEDYVIAKYYTLKELGIPVEKLRITYVKALRINQAHMVLTYFPTPDAIPLVLDNLIGKIYSADRRKDLEPVYSFNASGMWLERMKGEGIRMGNPNKLDLWTGLRLRMSKQGMEI